MAKGKRARSKTKTKTKKTSATKRATRRKAKTSGKTKKSAKKAPLRRALPKKPRQTGKRSIMPTPARPPAQSAAAPSTRNQSEQTALPEERIGVVTHYYSHLSVAILRLDSGTLRVGDMVHICGHTTDFSQKVESLEVNHSPATEVGPGDDFGLKVAQHAREHDVVYKVRP